MRVLVVCHANVTRSVAACSVLRGLDGEGRLDVRSAGTHVLEGQPVSLRTQQAFDLALGTPSTLGDHRAHQLQAADIEWADVVVVMEAAQVRLLRRQHPQASPRIGTLGHLATHLSRDARPLEERLSELRLETLEDDGKDDVADPAGGDDAAYLATMLELVDLCASFAGRLFG